MMDSLSGWLTKTVGDIAASQRNALVGGPFGSDLVGADYVMSGVPVIRGQNMSRGRWVDGEFAFVSCEKAERLSANTARPSDIVFTQRGTLGQVAIVPSEPYEEYVVSQSQMKLTVDSAMAEPLFVYYIFASDAMQRHIRTNAIQTGVPHINLGILRNVSLSLPPLPEQQAIAEVLGALDDKIELNRRMNATLEELARTIFRSWFVDFDPVHARAEGRAPFGMDANTAALFPDTFVPSELGDIPTGWRIMTLGSEIELAYGKPLKDADRHGGSVPVFGSNGKVGSHDQALVAGPGIVVGRKGTAGVVTWSHGDFFPIDTTFYVVPRGEVRSLYFWLFELEHQGLPRLTSDSAVPGLNRNQAYRNAVALPPVELVVKYDNTVVSLLDMVDGNEKQSQTLAELRDTLLPKLLSGEITVKAGERELVSAT